MRPAAILGASLLLGAMVYLAGKSAQAKDSNGGSGSKGVRTIPLAPTTYGVRDYAPGIGSGFGGVGRVEVFPIDAHSSEHVEGVAYEMLKAAETDIWVEALAERILQSRGLEFAPTYPAALALHDYVNNVMKTTDDPHNFEKMTDPGELSRLVLSGSPLPDRDCDDSAVMLTALFRIVGFKATVCFLDVNGDNDIDHAMSLVEVPEHGSMFAETTLPGMPLGWRPEYARAECLAL